MIHCEIFLADGYKINKKHTLLLTRLVWEGKCTAGKNNSMDQLQNF